MAFPHEMAPEIENKCAAATEAVHSCRVKGVIDVSEH